MEVLTGYWWAWVTGLLVLGGAGLLWRRWRRRQRRKPPSLSATDVVFLADEGTIVDETPTARQILGMTEHCNCTWDDLHDALAFRFPALPRRFNDALALAPRHIPSAVAGDSARLDLSACFGRLKVALHHPGIGTHQVLLHQALQDQATLATMTRAISAAPYPIWVQDDTGRETWRSPAYLRLRAMYLADEQDDLPLFDIDTQQLRDGGKMRFMLPDNSETGESWHEVSMSQDGGLSTFFAINVTALVRAERAQRSFVQTLTKTFAQLGTGLAIFDRDQQLVLFNPALIELTQMSAEFLSSRPTLLSFFDWLREARVMPEPRDYADWRQRLSELTKAAEDGTFSELWSLPNGLSYRVYGRPHPDGAIAFLFEDVTAELSLTRNFVSEIEINQSLLDALPDAVAIFSSTGDILSVNEAYKTLWGGNPNTQVQPINIAAAIDSWAKRSHPHDRWSEINYALNHPSRAKGVEGRLSTLNSGVLNYKVIPLTKGAVAIRFFKDASAHDPARQAADILA